MDAAPGQPLEPRIAPWRRASLVALFLAIAFGGALRWMRASADGITFDEMWHVELSTGRGSAHENLPPDTLVPAAGCATDLAGARPWYSVWTNMRGAVHPPLFCAALRLWEEAFGTGDVPLKSLAIVCALIATALLFDVVRIASSRGATTAAWTALLFSVAPMQVYLSQQARGYAMTQMWGCGLLAAAARIERLGINAARAMALGACALLLGLTHYFGIAANGAVALYLMVRLRGRARREALLAFAAAAAIYLIIWGPFMWEQRHTVAQSADPWLVEPAASRWDHTIDTLRRAAAIPVWQILAPPRFSSNWAVLLGATLLVVPIVLWRRRDDLKLWVFWLAGTLGFVTALDLFRSTRHLLFPRYTALAAPAVIALCAAIPRPVRAQSPRSLLPPAILVAALLGSAAAYPMRGGEPEWHLLGSLMQAELAGEDMGGAARQAIIFYSGARRDSYAGFLYLGLAHYAPDRFPRPVVHLTRPASPDLLAQLPGQTVWLISGALDRPADQILPGCTVLQQHELPNLAVCTQLRLPTATPHE